MEAKDKVCKNLECKKRFKPFKTTDNVCSLQCASELKKVKQKRKDEVKTETKRQAHKTKLELARITFNAYIRERDKNKPCICCGEPLGVNYQAGHYFSGGGHASVLFDETNVHAQRFECNNHKAGNFTEYGVNLEKRIGSLEFDLLRARAYEVKRWSIEELDAIIIYYREKKKEIFKK